MKLMARVKWIRLQRKDTKMASFSETSALVLKGVQT